MLFRNHNKKNIIVEHSGTVVNVTPTQITVNIVSLSACSGCHAKTFCSAFGQKEKNIIVPNIGQNIKEGDCVNVQMKQSLGMLAVLLAYLVPVAVIIASLLLLSEFAVSEPISAIIVLGILAVYYFILYLFRDKFKKAYNFYLVKTE